MVSPVHSPVYYYAPLRYRRWIYVKKHYLNDMGVFLEGVGVHGMMANQARIARVI